MRVVALEEHFSVPALVKRIDPGAISRRGYRPRKAPTDRPSPMELLPEIGERRLKSMERPFRRQGVPVLKRFTSKPRASRESERVEMVSPTRPGDCHCRE